MVFFLCYIINGDTMDNFLERSSYLVRIAELLNKKGNVDVEGYKIQDSDVAEFKNLLIIENLLFNKKLFIESTNSFKEAIELRLDFLKGSDYAIEKEALTVLLDILNKTPRTRLEDLTYNKRIIIPKEDEQRYIDNINKTTLGRAKPIRDASQKDLEDLTIEKSMKDAQKLRIDEYLDQNDSLFNEAIEELDVGIDSLQEAKKAALEFASQLEVSNDEYKDYLEECLSSTSNVTSKYYYQEMLDRYEKTKKIEELGYLYMKKSA
jgi:hypothetical protein